MPQFDFGVIPMMAISSKKLLITLLIWKYFKGMAMILNLFLFRAIWIFYLSGNIQVNKLTPGNLTEGI